MFLGVSWIDSKTNLIRRLIFGRNFWRKFCESFRKGKIRFMGYCRGERYCSINKIDYKDCDCILIEYDVTVKASFESDIKD